MKTKKVKVLKKSKKVAPKVKKDLSAVSTNEFFEQDFENEDSDSDDGGTSNGLKSAYII